MVTLGSLLARVISKKLEYKDSVEAALYRQFKKVSLKMPLGKLINLLHTHHFALVTHSQIQCKSFLKSITANCFHSIQR